MVNQNQIRLGTGPPGGEPENLKSRSLVRVMAAQTLKKVCALPKIFNKSRELIKGA